jgi:Tfp pilus assembly protein PilE
MNTIHQKISQRHGFTIMEIMIAAAILMVISLGVSQIMVSSQRSLNKSDSYLVRQTLEKYMSSMISTETSRCNTIQAKGALLACMNMCEACLAGSASCTAPSSNCRYYNSAANAQCYTGTDTSPADRVYMNLKDFSSATDPIAGGAGPGQTIVANLSAGNKVTDSGVPCGGTYAAATTSCRWRVTASYRPDYNDAMRFFLSIAYEPNETDDTTKIPTRSWEMVVPVSELCSTL